MGMPSGPSARREDHMPPVDDVCSFAPYRGSTITSPVKVPAAPFEEGREPFGEMTVLSAAAGAALRRASAMAIARICFIPEYLSFLRGFGYGSDLDCLALVHGAVAVRHTVKANGVVEDAARLDAALHHVGQEFGDVGTGGRRAARNADQLCFRHGFVMRNADAADGTPRTGNLHGRVGGLLRPDAFKHRVDAEAAGQLAHTLDRCLAALAHHVGGAQFLGERDAVRVTAHDDDLLGLAAFTWSRPTKLKFSRASAPTSRYDRHRLMSRAHECSAENWMISSRS